MVRRARLSGCRLPPANRLRELAPSRANSRGRLAPTTLISRPPTAPLLSQPHACALCSGWSAATCLAGGALPASGAAAGARGAGGAGRGEPRALRQPGLALTPCPGACPACWPRLGRASPCGARAPVVDFHVQRLGVWRQVAGGAARPSLPATSAARSAPLQRAGEAVDAYGDGLERLRRAWARVRAGRAAPLHSPAPRARSIDIYGIKLCAYVLYMCGASNGQGLASIGAIGAEIVGRKFSRPKSPSLSPERGGLFGWVYGTPPDLYSGLLPATRC